MISIELLNYVNNLNKHITIDPPKYFEVIEKLINDFISDNGLYPFMVSLNVRTYHELSREICYLPTWMNNWSQENGHITYCGVPIHPSTVCGEHSIRIR